MKIFALKFPKYHIIAHNGTLSRPFARHVRQLSRLISLKFLCLAESSGILISEFVASFLSRHDDFSSEAVGAFGSALHPDTSSSR